MLCYHLYLCSTWRLQCVSNRYVFLWTTERCRWCVSLTWFMSADSGPRATDSCDVLMNVAHDFSWRHEIRELSGMWAPFGACFTQHTRLIRGKDVHASETVSARVRHCFGLHPTYSFLARLERSRKVGAIGGVGALGVTGMAPSSTTKRQATSITSEDVRNGQIPHWRNWMETVPSATFLKVAIPSFDRPGLLCEATLPLLAKHAVPLDMVHVFVCPQNAPKCQTPEWHRYLETTRRCGFGAVHIEPGGVGLEGQMTCILRRFRYGHIIVMSDDVFDVEESVQKGKNQPELRPLPNGSLLPIFSHAESLMAAGNFHAWSVGCCSAAWNTSPTEVSRKCGLLNGNMFGLLRADDGLEDALPVNMGLIYDSALSCTLWSLQKYYFRYRGLCLKHDFKKAGGYNSVEKTAESRRLGENRLLKRLQKRFPRLVHFRVKPRASYKTMQQHFCQTGPGPLRMQPARAASSGRPREGFISRSMTAAERKRKQRHGRKALTET